MKRNSIQKVAVDAAPGKPAGCVWVVSQPEAHPLWDDYVITLADLTTWTGTPAFKKRDDVTHEMLLWAVNKERPIENLQDVVIDGTLNSHLLDPPNHGYQFTSESSESAINRINDLVEMIDEGKLNPDTDFTRHWNTLFEDGETLKR